MEAQPQTKTILVTGGLGYIGSHTIVELVTSLHNKKTKLPEANYKILIVDDLSNSSTAVIPRINQVLDSVCANHTGDYFEYQNGNVTDLPGLEAIFQARIDSKQPIEYIIHFAALKAVGESMQFPLKYFDNNFVGSLNLLKCMEKFNCKNFIFSSSATVYANNGDAKEQDPLSFANPYGCTKLIVEHMLQATAMCKKDWRVISLRYFNPCGAHESGMLGESPSNYPNNLFPTLEDVIVGKRERLSVFGSDYNTKDGTGVRDYLHVVDLAKAHVCAMNKLGDISGSEVYNLGTGTGYSVLEIIKTYEKVIGREIPHKIVDRRPGDIDVSQCNPSKANRELNWKAEKTLEDMCKDSYRWKTQNPSGYEKN